VAMVLKGDILAKLLNFYFGIMCLILIRAFVKRFFSFGSLLPAVVFYCNWLLYYVSTRANVELALGFFEGMMLFCLLLWLEARAGKGEGKKPRNALFYLSAVFCGFSLGIKYTALFSLVGICLVFLYYAFFVFRDAFITVVKKGAVYLLISFAVFSPWVIKNTIAYRMPLAPYRVFHHLALAAGISGSEEASSPDPVIEKLRKRNALLYSAFYPRRSLGEFLLIPYNATIHGTWPSQVFDTIVTPFYLMFLPFLIVIRKKKRAAIALLIYCIAVYIQWHVVQPITRYLTSAMIPMSLLVALVVQYFSKPERERICVIGHILKIMIIITIFIMLIAQLMILIYYNPLRYLLGYENRSGYLLRSNPTGIQKLIEHANENLPEKSRILLLWEKRGYYLQRPYHEDSSGHVFAMAMYKTDDPEKAADELLRMGYTHILCDTGLPRFWTGSGYEGDDENREVREMAKKEYAFFEEMARKRMNLLEKSGFLYLYGIVRD